MITENTKHFYTTPSSQSISQKENAEKQKTDLRIKEIKEEQEIIIRSIKELNGRIFALRYYTGSNLMSKQQKVQLQREKLEKEALCKKYKKLEKEKNIYSGLNISESQLDKKLQEAIRMFKKT